MREREIKISKKTVKEKKILPMRICNGYSSHNRQRDLRKSDFDCNQKSTNQFDSN